ncbi:hypothetical protein Vafri_10855 [Volvox africanus]|nr:hypothetical protein Vafri_10855 [Volvox africanus]
MPYSSKTVAVGITVAGMFPNLLFSYLIAAQLACTVYPDDWAARPRFIIGVILYAIGTAINRWADLKLRAGRLAMRKHAGQGKVAGCTGSTAAATPSSASTARESLLDADDGEGRVGESRSGSEVVRNTPTQGPRPRGDVRDQYFIPHGGLYELVSCPNYLGELIEWAGYALAVWSWPALAWMLFGLSTFIPRSLTHQRWYREHFGNEYPAKRKALIPFIL